MLDLTLSSNLPNLVIPLSNTNSRVNLKIDLSKTNSRIDLTINNTNLRQHPLQTAFSPAMFKKGKKLKCDFKGDLRKDWKATSKNINISAWKNINVNPKNINFNALCQSDNVNAHRQLDFITVCLQKQRVPFKKMTSPTHHSYHQCSIFDHSYNQIFDHSYSKNSQFCLTKSIPH